MKTFLTKHAFAVGIFTGLGIIATFDWRGVIAMGSLITLVCMIVFVISNKKSEDTPEQIASFSTLPPGTFFKKGNGVIGICQKGCGNSAWSFLFNCHVRINPDEQCTVLNIDTAKLEAALKSLQ